MSSPENPDPQPEKFTRRSDEESICMDCFQNGTRRPIPIPTRSGGYSQRPLSAKARFYFALHAFVKVRNGPAAAGMSLPTLVLPVSTLSTADVSMIKRTKSVDEPAI